MSGRAVSDWSAERYHYVVCWSEADAGWLATCTEFPGLHYISNMAPGAALGGLIGTVQRVLVLKQQRGELAPRPRSVLGREDDVQWIDAKETKPSDQVQPVLVYGTNTSGQIGYAVAFYSGGVWFGVIPNPTHWCLLPDPPGEDD